MSYESLAEFLSGLQDHGELQRITASVDPALELTAISDRVAKTATDGGPALHFENVKNSTFPVATNLLGSRRRLCLALGVSDLDEFSNELNQRIQSPQSGGWLEAFKLIPDLGGQSRWNPKLVKTGACQQVVRLGRDVNLWDLPVPRCWPGEHDPVITSGLIVAKFPAGPKGFRCRAPLLITGQHELAWYDGDPHQNSLLTAAVSSGTNLPIAISLGGDPSLMLGTSLSEITDPLSFSGLIRGNSLEVVRCRTNELEVPATAEIVIEGYLDAANAKSSRSLTLARQNGRYVQRELPLIQVTAITHRANPVFPAIVVSTPPSEESWLGLAAERLMLPMLVRRIPELVDIRRPFSGAGRNLLFVSIRKTKDFQARRVLHALWGMESIGDAKMIVIVDAETDLKNEADVWFTVGNLACPGRDFLFSDGLARDDDYTPATAVVGSKVGIDATRKTERESMQAFPEQLKMSDDILTKITERWAEYGLQL